MNFRDSRNISFLKSIDDDNYLWFISHIQVFLLSVAPALFKFVVSAVFILSIAKLYP